MKTKWTALVICVLIVNLLISSCGLGQPFGPTFTPMPTLTPTTTSTPVPPTNTPTPEPIGEVQTSQGALIITSTERASGWPVNCDPKANFSLGEANACFIVPNSGYEILIVNIVPKDPAIEKIDVDLDANIYVSTEDGQQYELGSAGFSGEAQNVMFSVPIGEKGLILYWEDNTPIPLP